MTQQPTDASQNQTDVMVCYNHPQRQTNLRCNRCNRPICSECAVLTPTGYRCKACINSQQKSFDTATTLDLVLAGLISVGLSFFGSFFAQTFGFFSIFVAPLVGIGIAELIRVVVHRRRSRLLFRLTLIGAVVGSLPLLLSVLLGMVGVALMGSFTGAAYGLTSLILQGLYTFLVAGTAFSRLSGIQLRR